MHESAPYQVGAAYVEPRANSARVGGQSVKLEPRMTRVLGVLARAQGAVVTREELLRQAWEQTFPSDEALTQIISKLRRALRDAAPEPIIETTPKSGYRLTCAIDLNPPRSGSASAPSISTTPITPWRSNRAMLALLAALLVAAILAIVFLTTRNDDWNPEFPVEDFDIELDSGPTEQTDPDPR